MYNRIRRWFRWEAKHAPRDFVIGIKNLWKWFPTIWRQRDWDGSFILDIISKKLEFQAKYIGEKNRHTTAQQDVERMRLVIKLIKLEQDEYYNMEYMDYAEDRVWWTPCEDRPGSSLYNSETIWEKYNEYFAKYPLCYKRAVQYIRSNQNQYVSKHIDKKLIAMVMGDLRQAKCKDLIFKIMGQDINKWWD